MLAPLVMQRLSRVCALLFLITLYNGMPEVRAQGPSLPAIVTQIRSNLPDSTLARLSSRFCMAKSMLLAHRDGANFDSLHPMVIRSHKLPKNCNRGNSIVYGFHPYWLTSAWKSYDFQVLSHVSYFAYEVNLKTGGPLSKWDWATTPMIDSAQKAGCKVHLTVTTVGSGGYSREMLNNPTVAATCIDSISAWVRKRHADGVCIDFEDMDSRDTLAFVNWVRQLRTALRKDNPRAEIAIAGYALSQATRFSLPSLNEVIDYMVIMGYDYAWSGSKTASCTAPLPGNGYSINLEATIDGYTKGGMDASRLVLALPYYGPQWNTAGTSSGNTALKYLGAMTYSNLQKSIPKGNKRAWDPNSVSSYFSQSASDGQYIQSWVLDSQSLAQRYDMIKSKGIAGTGIWALGYDNGYTGLWDLLHAKFGACDSTLALPDSLKIPRRPPATTDATADSIPEWHRKNRWMLPWVMAAALVILVLVVLLSRKAREEVLNSWSLYPLVTFVALVVSTIVWELLSAAACWPEFPWVLLLGAILVWVAFRVGVIWSRNRQQDL